MNRVFIPERNHRYDLSPAESYGTLTYMNAAGSGSDPESGRLFNPLNSLRTIDRMHAAFIELEFDPQKDYLCLTGQAITVAMMLAVAATRYSSFRVMMFDSRTSNYVVRTFANTATTASQE